MEGSHGGGADKDYPDKDQKSHSFTRRAALTEEAILARRPAQVPGGHGRGGNPIALKSQVPKVLNGFSEDKYVFAGDQSWTSILGASLPSATSNDETPHSAAVTAACGPQASAP
jgi:hypothetical protein